MNDAQAVAESRPKIEFRDVTKRFYVRKSGAEVDAIIGLDLAIHENEFVCLVGPSGCGKSTLLNMLAGFEMATSGEVLLEGKPITGPDPERGVIFQDGALFPWLTVMDNVCYGPRRRRVPREEYIPRTKAILQQVGLERFMRSMPTELSGGMRQRVAIARALVNRPQVLLMDEPFGALDAQTRVLMQELLLDVWQGERRTVLFITHDVDESVFLADRVIAMSRRPGRVLADLRVPLPRPRTYDMMTSLDFLKTKAQVFDLIRREAAIVADMR